MQNIEDLRKELRAAKNNLLKVSKVLLFELEQKEHPDEETRQEIDVLTERIGFIEGEIWADLDRLQGKDPGKQRLEKALETLKQQLYHEKELFANNGDNADKLLDLNFRVQEIEEALNAKK